MTTSLTSTKAARMMTPGLILGGLLGPKAEFAELGNRLDAIFEKYGFGIFHAVDVKHGKRQFFSTRSRVDVSDPA